MAPVTTMLGALLLCVFGALAHADVTGLGRAAVSGQPDSARNLAEQMAIRDAATRAVDDYVTRHGVDRMRYARVREQLLAAHDRYLVQLTTTETRNDGTLLEVDVWAEVDEVVLKRVLEENGLLTGAELESASRMPSVMVFIYEEMHGQASNFSFARQAIQRGLLQAGYPVVDEAAMRRVLDHDLAVQAVTNSNVTGLASAALKVDAELVVSGQALVQPSSMASGGMTAYGATLALQVHAADTGEIIASATSDGTYPHINALQGARGAVEDAVAKTLPPLLGDVTANRTHAARTLRMSIANVNFEQLTYLKEIIQSDYPEVTAIDNLGFVDGIALLRVTMLENPTVFAERLASTPYNTFRLEVLAQSPGKLDLALRL